MCNICEVVPQRYLTYYRCTYHETIVTKDKDTKTRYGTCQARNRINSLRPHVALPHADEICGGKSPQILKHGTAEIRLKS